MTPNNYLEEILRQLNEKLQDDKFRKKNQEIIKTIASNVYKIAKVKVDDLDKYTTASDKKYRQLPSLESLHADEILNTKKFKEDKTGLEKLTKNNKAFKDLHHFITHAQIEAPVKKSKAFYLTREEQREFTLQFKSPEEQKKISEEISLEQLEKQGAFKNLPNEVKFEIFSLLDPKDLANLSRTGKQFYKFANEDALWKKQLKKFFPDEKLNEKENPKNAFIRLISNSYIMLFGGMVTSKYPNFYKQTSADLLRFLNEDLLKELGRHTAEVFKTTKEITDYISSPEIRNRAVRGDHVILETSLPVHKTNELIKNKNFDQIKQNIQEIGTYQAKGNTVEIVSIKVNLNNKQDFEQKESATFKAKK